MSRTLSISLSKVDCKHIKLTGKAKRNPVTMYEGPHQTKYVINSGGGFVFLLFSLTGQEEEEKKGEAAGLQYR